jgi:hypothetical protein
VARRVSTVHEEMRRIMIYHTIHVSNFVSLSDPGFHADHQAVTGENKALGIRSSFDVKKLLTTHQHDYPQGQVLIHPGELFHKGVDITDGTRYLVVCFVDGFDPGIPDPSSAKGAHDAFEGNTVRYFD